MPLIVLASALLGILGVVVAFRARLARRASSVRRSFGDPQRFDPDARTGTSVCLEGRIRGARVASWSGLPAEDAPRDLELEVDGTRIPIRGRAAVLAGSRETVPARGRALRSVVPDDRVRVRAKIIRDAIPAGAGYRDVRTGIALEGVDARGSSSPPSIEAFDDRGIVEIAFAGGPRPASLGVSRYAFGSLSGVVVGVIASFGALYTHRPESTPSTPILSEPQPIKTLAPPAPCIDSEFDSADFATAALRGDEAKLTGTCALRRAEADLATHHYAQAAAAVRAYANGMGEGEPANERREALQCIADSLAMRSDPGTFVRGTRAMCKALAASRMPIHARVEALGTRNWVWFDNQGMFFATGPVLRASDALLIEANSVPSDTGRYQFYPDAYLAKNEPGDSAPYTSETQSFEHFEGGADVKRLEWEGKKTIDSMPFAFFASLVASGRPTRAEKPAVRMYVRGNLAMFLAATGDVAGARRELVNLADIPDDTPHAPFWTRPSVSSIRKAIDELAAGAAPFRMHGEMWGVLAKNLARAKSDPAAARATERVRSVLLDRDIAIELYFLEAFARR